MNTNIRVQDKKVTMPTDQIRISEELNHLLEATKQRLQKIEEEQDKKFKDLRKIGDGLNSDRILIHALQYYLSNEGPPLGEKRDVPDGALTETERKAMEDHAMPFARDGRIIEKTAEHLEQKQEEQD